MAGAGYKSWSAGNVLTASDVNTYLMEQAVMSFAGTAARGSALPSPSAGMVSHIGGGTVQVYNGTAWTDIDTVGGLVKIAANTFSAQSTVSINDCFSSTYENYLLIVRVSAASTNSQVRLRLRVSGTDDTGSNYAYANRYLRLDAGGSGTGTGSAATAMQLAATQNSADGCSAVINIVAPNLTVYTKMSGFAVNQQNSGDVYLYDQGCMHTLSTAYTGCTVAVDTGTFTGTVRVYGYRN